MAPRRPALLPARAGIPLLCAHVSMSPEADPTEVLHEITEYCRAIGITHSTIQVRTQRAGLGAAAGVGVGRGSPRLWVAASDC